MKEDKLISLVKTLISKKSITPFDDGVMNVLINFLSGLGFKSNLQNFSSQKNDGNIENVLNLYSYKNFVNKDENDAALLKNLCFAGHVDVVHPGKEYKWMYPAFEPTIENGILYGRGVSDMKAAIACFCIAVNELIEEKINITGTISFLITGDEEGSGENGTKKMLQYLQQNNIVIDDCIIGEPTNPEKMGTMIKIGRRGSVTFNLTIEGIQGHIAYPENFLNPIDAIAGVILKLKSYQFDNGNEFFNPTNLEFFKIEADNIASNVVPNSSSIGFNIRFNNLHSSNSIIKIVESIISKEINDLNNDLQSDFKYKYQLKTSTSGESFITQSDIHLVKSIQDAVRTICNSNPVLSTSGGTSDARFIKDYTHTVEFGMISKTAHQIDENEKVQDIITLKNIYKQFIKNYFLL